MSAEDSTSLSLWSALSLLGLVLVIIGVMMEGAEASIWTISWFKRKKLSIIWSNLPEPHIPRWAHRLDHVGWFILVIGLALETWGHIRVTDITGRENDRLTKQLDSTTQQASSANKLAAELNKEAADARLEASRLKKQLNETQQTVNDVKDLAFTNNAEIQDSKIRTAVLHEDWYMSKNGSLTKARLEIKELSFTSIPRGRYKINMVFSVRNFSVDPTTVDPTNIFSCRTISCGFYCTKWVTSKGSMVVVANGQTNYMTQNGKNWNTSNINPTESDAEISVHTQTLEIWLPDSDSSLTPTIGRKTPCDTDVWLLKDTTRFVLTRSEDQTEPIPNQP